MKHYLSVLCVLVVLAASTKMSCAQQVSAPVDLVKEGRAQFPIVVSGTASEQTVKQAHLLADYLKRIGEAEFSVVKGNGENGITLGVHSDFPQLEKTFGLSAQMPRESYLIRSHPKGLFLVGLSEEALSHAIWDFLYQLGYRYYFPGKNWEIIPSLKNISLSIDKTKQPHFMLRDLFVRHDTWPENASEWEAWKNVNRIGRSFSLNTAHSWNTVIGQFSQEFERHPEYFALVKGKRAPRSRSVKFCLSNSGVRDIVSRYALKFFADNPEQDSVSIDPTDHGGWCECTHCIKIGSPSDRMAFLANEVVEKVREKYPQKYVAFYAYSHHAAPPAIDLKPGIIVSVTTAFRSGRLSLERTIQGWRDKGAQIGIRDYASVASYEAFGVGYYSKSSRISDYVQSLEAYAKLPEKYYRSELGDDWGPNGLGYYIASRLLWNIDESSQVNALIDEFLEKSFEDAAPPMREFYRLINGIDQTTPPPFDEYYLLQLYGHLNDAWQSTDNIQVKSRLSDLILYTSYLEKYLAFLNSTGSQQQSLFEEIVRYTYQIRRTHMVHDRTMYPYMFANKIGPQGQLPGTTPGVRPRPPQGEYPWHVEREFTPLDIQNILQGYSQRIKPFAIPESITVLNSQENALQSIFHLRGRSRFLIVPQNNKEVTISTRLNDNMFNFPRSFIIRDRFGKSILSGEIANQKNIRFSGEPNQIYELFIFSSNNGGPWYKLALSNCMVAVQTNLDQGSIHLFSDPQDFYIYIPADINDWEFKLNTTSPSETAAVKIYNPENKLVETLETKGEVKEQKTILPAQEGLWKISVGEATTGAFQSSLLTFDPKLSPWSSRHFKVSE